MSNLIPTKPVLSTTNNTSPCHNISSNVILITPGLKIWIKIGVFINKGHFKHFKIKINL